MKRGLVIGKFYPFHAGHAYLTSVAREQSDQLTVIVCDRSDQSFTGAERAVWIREMFPDIEVRVMRDIMDDDNSKRWAEYTINFLGYAPDRVFTSEDYGDAYARYLGAEHILVDRERHEVPISGTRIRENPYTSWQYLGASARAALVRRVALVGAESTGTTTLSRSLAEYFETVWVPEFGRLYSEGKLPSQTAWQSDEFVFIANTQNRVEDAYARLANKVLFCDTNAWATRLWHERYRGTLSAEVDQVAKGRRYDLVILTGDEIPFVDDGMRDGEYIRHTMQKRFQELLTTEDIPHLVVSGTPEERLAQAVRACERLLVSGSDVFQRFPREESFGCIIDTMRREQLS